tara:strand:+ start:374 stop:481 length:108 start_codon:yes stop_codon:yes gene_type:complete
MNKKTLGKQPSKVKKGLEIQKEDNSENEEEMDMMQ